MNSITNKVQLQGGLLDSMARIDIAMLENWSDEEAAPWIRFLGSLSHHRGSTNG
jgi:hypothetical protein